MDPCQRHEKTEHEIDCYRLESDKVAYCSPKEDNVKHSLGECHDNN